MVRNFKLIFFHLVTALSAASPGPAGRWQGTCEAGLHQTFGRTNPYPQVSYSQQFSNGSFPPRSSQTILTVLYCKAEANRNWLLTMPRGTHRPRLCSLGCLQNPGQSQPFLQPLPWGAGEGLRGCLPAGLSPPEDTW